MQFASPYAKIVTREGGGGRQDHPDREPHDHVELHDETPPEGEGVALEPPQDSLDIAHIDLAA